MKPDEENTHETELYMFIFHMYSSMLCYTNMPVLCCNPIHLDVEKPVIQNHLNTDKITLAEVLNISFKATCKETTEIVLSVSDCWHLQKNNVLLYPVT